MYHRRIKLINRVIKSGTDQPQWHHGPIAPIVLTFTAVLAWLIFILLYALFWSKGYSLFQNVIVTVVTLAIVGLLIGLMWVVWGTRHAGRPFVWSY